MRKWSKLMRSLRGIWNLLFLAAGARFGYVLYTDPAARVTAKDWLVWLANGGLFRDESAGEIVANVVLILSIIAFFDAVRSTLAYLFRWFSPATRRLRCPSCDRIVGRADKFCTNCGSPIQSAELKKAADINNKSRSSMVGVAVILLLVTTFALFWLVSHVSAP